MWTPVQPATAHPWQMVLAFFQASQSGEFVTMRSTVDEMSSAGQIGLISKLEVRSAISNYYSLAVNASLSERSLYRAHVRGLIPIDAQTYIWANCFSTVADGPQELIDCDSPIPQEKAAEVAEMVRQNAPVMAELRYYISVLDIASVIARTRQQEATHIRELIAEVLRKP